MMQNINDKMRQFINLLTVSSFHQRFIQLLVIMAPVFYLGIGNKYPWTLLGSHGIDIGIIVFFVITIIFFLFSFLGSFTQLSESRLFKIFILNLIFSILFALTYDFIQYKHFLRFGYLNPIGLYILSILMVMAIYIQGNSNLKYIFICCCGYSILHYLLSIYYFPVDTARSDMLPAIALSLKQFLAGVSPYAKYDPKIGIPPYLPVTMLSFLPGVLFSIDLRLVGLVYWIINLILIVIKFDSLNLPQKFAISLFIVNPYFLMRHDLYFQFFLLELTIICFFYDKLNSLLKVILLGVSVATLQFAWLLLPFIVLSEKTTKLRVLMIITLSIFIAVLICIGYSYHGINDFYHAIFLHKEYTQPYSSDITFGLSTIFHFATSQVILYVLQLFCCALILLFAIYQYIVQSNHSVNLYFSLASICYLIFMSTNYFIETYLFMPMLLFIIISFKGHYE